MIPNLNNMITKNIQIEELVDKYPFSVRYLMENKIRCIMCGEPIWGSLEEAAKEKNYVKLIVLVIIISLFLIFDMATKLLIDYVE